MLKNALLYGFVIGFLAMPSTSRAISTTQPLTGQVDEQSFRDDLLGTLSSSTISGDVTFDPDNASTDPDGVFTPIEALSIDIPNVGTFEEVDILPSTGSVRLDTSPQQVAFIIFDFAADREIVASSTNSDAGTLRVFQGGETALDASLEVVPIPAALPLFFSALVGLGLATRRRSMIPRASRTTATGAANGSAAPRDAPSDAHDRHERNLLSPAYA